MGVKSDVNGCSFNESFEIVEPEILATQVAKVDVACNGEATGSIALNISGGTPGYAILWSNGESTVNLSGLAAGQYE